MSNSNMIIAVGDGDAGDAAASPISSHVASRQLFGQNLGRF